MSWGGGSLNPPQCCLSCVARQACSCETEHTPTSPDPLARNKQNPSVPCSRTRKHRRRRVRTHGGVLGVLHAASVCDTGLPISESPTRIATATTARGPALKKSPPGYGSATRTVRCTTGHHLCPAGREHLSHTAALWEQWGPDRHERLHPGFLPAAGRFGCASCAVGLLLLTQAASKRKSLTYMLALNIQPELDANPKPLPESLTL